MKMNRIFKIFIVFIITLSVLFNFIPGRPTSAASAKKYLVLVNNYDGTFIAYDDLVVEVSNSIMVKAKPLAQALGLQYTNGNGLKKGCVLASGNAKNIYTRNSKTYEYNYEGTVTKETAKYKQCYINSDNLVHYDTVRTLVNCSFFTADKAPEYKKLGYTGGVIVYNIFEYSPTLPKTSTIVKWGDKLIKDNLKTRNITITPTVRDNTQDDFTYKYIDVYFYEYIHCEKVLFDFDKIQKTFIKYKLPGDGIYGYGHCNGSITLQGIDKNGKVIKETTTKDDVFLVDFPGAVKLCIISDKSNVLPYIVFTPVKPIVITDTASIPFSQVNWLTASDGFARQYFVLAEYVDIGVVNIDTSAFWSEDHIEKDNPDNNTTDNSYSVVPLLVEKSATNLTSDDILVEAKKDINLLLIDNSILSFYGTSKDLWADNYEEELMKMINAVRKISLESYFPNTSIDCRLFIRTKDVVISNAGDEQAVLDIDLTDLDCAQDYLTSLHEITHYYDAQRDHYSWMIPSWTEGIAEVLSRQAMAELNIAEDYSIHYFPKLELPETAIADFETYYLNLERPDCYNIGYHFNTYLQTTYGKDIINNILEEEQKANIAPKINGLYCRDNERDKLFTDCIKAVTSDKVFQDFVQYYQKLN